MKRLEPHLDWKTQRSSLKVPRTVALVCESGPHTEAEPVWMGLNQVICHFIYVRVCFFYYI